MNQKVALTYGTFDLFHIGHLNLFKRAKEYGDKLIVAVSTDEFNEIKGKKVMIPFEQRAEIVRNIKCVDLVIPEKNWEQKVDDIQKYDVDVIVMGNDWKGKFDDLKEFCEVIYLSRTKDISTTYLKKSLKNLLSVSREQFSLAFEILDQIKKDLE